MATTIRAATPADVPQILAFIRALAAYERAPDAVTATEADLMRDGFGPNPFYSCLIAEHDGQPAGFALYFFNYSTWMGRPGLYLEDIFVRAGVSRPGNRQGAAATGGGHRRGKGLPAPAVGGAGLEHAGHRVLSRHGSRVSGRVAECARERRGAEAAGRRARQGHVGSAGRSDDKE